VLDRQVHLLGRITHLVHLPSELSAEETQGHARWPVVRSFHGRRPAAVETDEWSEKCFASSPS
jgi:hypothetical protein